MNNGTKNARLSRSGFNSKHISTAAASYGVVPVTEQISEFGRPSRILGHPTVLFNKYRMVMMVELYYAGALEFTQLRHDLGINDGSLANHIKALIKRGLITKMSERFTTRIGRRKGRDTVFLITPKGIETVNQLFLTFEAEGKQLSFAVEEE